MTDRENNGRIWGVVWSELFPWLILFRTFRIAISFRLLVLGATGMMAMLFGAYAILWYFAGDTSEEKHILSAFAVEIQNTDWFSHVFGYDANAGWVVTENSDGVQVVAPRPHRFNEAMPQILAVWEHFELPFHLSMRSGHRFRNFFCCVAVGLWGILVWGFFGTAISRSAAVHLVSGGRTSFRETLDFGFSKWRAGFAAPFLPCVGILLLAMPILLLGLLLRLGFLAWIGAVAWPIALVAGFVITILLLGLIFGWPLMLSAIAVEGSDCFDSLSRTYAYIYQRPLHYLFYVVIAFLFGVLCWYFVLFFANLMIETTRWIANWIMVWISVDDSSIRGPLGVIRVWEMMFKLLVMGFSATYFWSAATAIYLLLRRDTDAVELDEIYTESEAAPRGLPKIVTDEKGAPAVEG